MSQNRYQTIFFAIILTVCNFCNALGVNTNNTSGPENSVPKIAVVAHMANTTGAVDWALTQGANGVEMDVNFLSSGQIDEFRHGGICDCSTLCAIGSTCGSDNVCRVLWDTGGEKHCNASAQKDAMMSAIANNAASLALVYVDSKITDEMSDEAKNTAGKEIIRLFNTAFSKGFRGQVLIGAPSLAYTDTYLASAVKEANNSPYKDSYFFTIDGEGASLAPGANFFPTIKALVKLSPNRVSSMGITTSVPKRYYTEIQLAAMNQKNSTIGGNVIWTIDDDKAMDMYFSAGANIIVSNQPKRLYDIAKSLNKSLAKPGELLVRATSDLVVGETGAPLCTSSSSQCACARETASDNPQMVCCKSGKTHMYAGYLYCAELPDTSICWSDAMCASGLCKGNSGGTKKGICIARSPVGASCNIDANCANNACGRATANDGAIKVCCASGSTTRYAGYDYCTSMPSQSTCWANTMCASGTCKGNWYGTKKGTCK
jgi:hypothetical protein